MGVNLREHSCLYEPSCESLRNPTKLRSLHLLEILPDLSQGLSVQVCGFGYPQFVSFLSLSLTSPYSPLHSKSRLPLKASKASL